MKNPELILKYRKVLKEQFNKGIINEKEYLNSLESLREKKPKKQLTLIERIKTLF